MISITTDTLNYQSPLIIHETTSSDLTSKTARIARTATLDGGVYINNSGFSDGDRTLKVVARLSLDQVTKLDYISKYFTSIVISMSDGIYIGAIESIKNTGDQYTISIFLEGAI